MNVRALHCCVSMQWWLWDCQYIYCDEFLSLLFCVATRQWGASELSKEMKYLSSELRWLCGVWLLCRKLWKQLMWGKACSMWPHLYLVTSSNNDILLERRVEIPLPRLMESNHRSCMKLRAGGFVFFCIKAPVGHLIFELLDDSDTPICGIACNVNLVASKEGKVLKILELSLWFYALKNYFL